MQNQLAEGKIMRFQELGQRSGIAKQKTWSCTSDREPQASVNYLEIGSEEEQNKICMITTQEP